MNDPAAAPADPCPADIAARVRFDQIRSHYQLTPQPVAAGMLFAMMLAWAAAPSAGHRVALGWLAIKLIGGAVRLVQHLRFTRDPHAQRDAERWYRRYLLWMVVDSLSWGAVGVLFLPTGVDALDAVLVASVVGVAAAGVFTLIGSLASNALFLVCVLVPLALHWLWVGTAWGLFGGAGLLVYLSVLLFEAWRGERLFLEMTRLRHENEWIAEERRRALVLAEQSSAAKSRFLASVSHEVRTPLNGILGMAQVLAGADLGPQERQQVRAVIQSARHLRTIIGDILDLASIEAGRATVQHARLDLAAVVREVTELLAPMAAHKGLGFDVHTEPGLARHWNGDAARIRQVLHNLVGNAIKFTARGSVELHVEGRAQGLRFTVRDSGPGVPLEWQSRVFEPFEQAPRAAGTEGTGLGLTIARQLARAMGGDVVLAASSSAGSTFLCDVNAIPEPASSAAEEGPMPPAAPTLSGIEAPVLVVEDNEVNALVAGAMLERLGLRHVHAPNGEQALRLLGGRAFALVLMDCRMPVLDGLETTRRWRGLEAAEPGRPRTPVIALTADAGDDDRQRCLQAGMDDYVAKPLEWAELVDLLARHARRGPIGASPGLPSTPRHDPPRSALH